MVGESRVETVSNPESLRAVVSGHRETFELLAESDLPVAEDVQRILEVLEEGSTDGDEQCCQ